MKENTAINNPTANRPESVNFLDKYFSVQFSINSMEPTYLFKLRSNSLNGLFILVREDSAVLKHLKMGDIVNMRYNTLESSNSTKSLKTLIRDISKNPQRSFMEHFLVGLYIIDEQDGRL
ncbi:MAG: hypothetical protein JRJ41_01965 [Deltaproteobacteria bacterium]|jgi:hypothetical protein|nr:hypothetical protein [Deltaproteobacteria bacterium]